ncbi:hypothetical protein Tco_0912417 [Tanacetum coccineum]
MSSDKSTHVEEPSHTVEDSSMQQDQEFITGDNDEQFTDKEVTKANWFKKPERPPTPDPDWKILVGPAFNLLKGTCKSITELEYHLEECSKATTERLDWHNPENKLRIVIQKRVEDLQLGVESYQKKLNLTKPDTYRLNIRNKTAYTSYSDPYGIIYVDQYKRKRLMHADELHKFSDGTLNDVRSALHDIAAGIRM